MTPAVAESICLVLALERNHQGFGIHMTRGIPPWSSFFREMEGDLASTFVYLFQVTLSPADKTAGVCGGELREKNRELGLI